MDGLQLLTLRRIDMLRHVAIGELYAHGHAKEVVVNLSDALVGVPRHGTATVVAILCAVGNNRVVTEPEGAAVQYGSCCI